MTYPLVYRKKVFQTKEKQNLTFQQTSDLFGISMKTLFRWHIKMPPCMTRRRPSQKIDLEKLKKDVENHPDDYIWERAERFGVSKSGIRAALIRLKITYKKKTLYHPKANAEKRDDFQQKMKKYEDQGKEIVYLDESGFAHDMPRTHGYSKQGARCYGCSNWQAKGRINAIGAIAGFLFITVSLFQGSINANIFYAWLTQDLLPKINPGSVIVMDNASFHKRADIAEAIKTHGCILEYLPPYSPDLNPIEKKWSQAKSIRRRERCDVNTLFSADF